jgi:hypothetical protein
VTDPDALVPSDELLAARLEPSPRLRGVALALAIVLGFAGAHRFYAGRVGSGILQLCTLGGLGLWWLYDAILIGAGEFTDADGRPLVKWNRYDEPLLGGTDDRRMARMLDDMDALRRELTDLAERVDFHERLLSQHRDKGRLP